MPHGKVLRVEKDGFGIVDIEGSDRFGFFSRERTTVIGQQPRVSVGDEVDVDVIDTGKDALVISRMAVVSNATRPTWHRWFDLRQLFRPRGSPDDHRGVRARSE